MNLNKRLAVILVGAQNSGKTTSIKYFDHEYDEYKRLKKQCRAGGRSLLLHKKSLRALFSYIYFVPASPTETKKSLKSRLKEWRPEMILIAEQIDKGENWNRYKETKDFLDFEGYEVVEILIGDDARDDIWKKWKESKFEDTMKKRAELIGNHFRIFIKNQIK